MENELVYRYRDSKRGSRDRLEDAALRLKRCAYQGWLSMIEIIPNCYTARSSSFTLSLFDYDIPALHHPKSISALRSSTHPRDATPPRELRGLTEEVGCRPSLDYVEVAR